MGELLLVADVAAELAGITLFRGSHKFFKALIPCTEKHKLHILTAHHIVQNTGHEIKAFLLCHAGHHAEKRHIRARFKPHGALQHAFADGLSGHIVRRKIPGNRRVCFRIKKVPVDSVDDSGCHRSAGIQNTVQALAVIGRSDLGGIGRAHGVDPVGKDAAGFQIVRAAVQLDKLRRIITGVHAEHILYKIKAEFALERDVVNRQQVFYMILHLAAVLGMRQHGNHGCVPVVAVDDIRLKVQLGHNLQDGPCKIGILFSLHQPAEVDFPSKIILIIHKINRNAVQNNALNSDISVAPSQPDAKIEQVLYPVGICIFNTAMIGGDDTGFHAGAGKGFWQRTDNVCQAAGFG